MILHLEPKVFKITHYHFIVVFQALLNDLPV